MEGVGEATEPVAPHEEVDSSQWAAARARAEALMPLVGSLPELGLEEAQAEAAIRAFTRFLVLKAVAGDVDATVLSPHPVVDEVGHGLAWLAGGWGARPNTQVSHGRPLSPEYLGCPALAPHQHHAPRGRLRWGRTRGGGCWAALSSSAACARPCSSLQGLWDGIVRGVELEGRVLG